MVLCAFLVYKGKNFPETENDPLQKSDKPLPYLFYRGIELHPRIFDIDIKQVTVVNSSCDSRYHNGASRYHKMG